LAKPQQFHVALVAHAKRALALLETQASHAAGQQANVRTIWQQISKVVSAVPDNATTKLKVASNAHKVNARTSNVVMASANTKIKANLFCFLTLGIISAF